MDSSVELLLRWLHILAAMTAVGGALFSRFALLPVAASLPEEQRRAVLEGVRKHWAKFVHAAVGLLLISGLYNYLFVVKAKYSVDKPYDMLFGIKFLLAIVVFGIAEMLVGRSEAAQRFRQRWGLWLNVKLVLLVGIVGVSGIMRSIPHTPKAAAAAAAAAAASDRAP